MAISWLVCGMKRFCTVNQPLTQLCMLNNNPSHSLENASILYFVLLLQTTPVSGEGEPPWLSNAGMDASSWHWSSEVRSMSHNSTSISQKVIKSQDVPMIRKLQTWISHKKSHCFPLDSQATVPWSRPHASFSSLLLVDLFMTETSPSMMSTTGVEIDATHQSKKTKDNREENMSCLCFCIFFSLWSRLSISYIDLKSCTTFFWCVEC